MWRLKHNNVSWDLEINQKNGGKKNVFYECSKEYSERGFQLFSN